MHWEGHKPATAAALFDVLTNATTATGRISEFDRILFTACEFWASVNNGMLLRQLTENPAVPQLQAAESAFAQIGLNRAAEIIRRGRLALSAVDSPVSFEVAVKSIEQSLSESNEPVDQSIADYVNNQILKKPAHGR
jgi:hypothetical protein